MLSRFFLNNSNKKMFAPHAVHIAVIISSLIASLCFTFAEPFDAIFLFVKSCIGQRKYKQKFTTQGVKDRLTDRSTKRVNSHSPTKLSYFAFCKIVIKTRKLKTKNITYRLKELVPGCVISFYVYNYLFLLFEVCVFCLIDQSMLVW